MLEYFPWAYIRSYIVYVPFTPPLPPPSLLDRHLIAGFGGEVHLAGRGLPSSLPPPSPHINIDGEFTRKTFPQQSHYNAAIAKINQRTNIACLF